MKLYDHLISQHGYKVRLFFSMNEKTCEWHQIDFGTRENRSDEYLKLNPNGKIPTLIDEGQSIWESNAILSHLDHKWQSPAFKVPANLETQVQQWLLWETSALQTSVSLARFLSLVVPKEKQQPNDLPQAQKQGAKALKLLDEHLSSNDFVASKLSIADISIYGSTCIADQGGLDVSDLPNYLEWKKRIEALPGFITINDPLN